MGVRWCLLGTHLQSYLGLKCSPLKLVRSALHGLGSGKSSGALLKARGRRRPSSDEAESSGPAVSPPPRRQLFDGPSSERLLTPPLCDQLLAAERLLRSANAATSRRAPTGPGIRMSPRHFLPPATRGRALLPWHSSRRLTQERSAAVSLEDSVAACSPPSCPASGRRATSKKAKRVPRQRLTEKYAVSSPFWGLGIPTWGNGVSVAYKRAPVDVGGLVALCSLSRYVSETCNPAFNLAM